MAGILVPSQQDHEALAARVGKLEGDYARDLARLDQVEERLNELANQPQPEVPEVPQKPARWPSGAYHGDGGVNYTQAGPDDWQRRFGYRPELWLVYADRWKSAELHWQSPHLINTTAFTDKNLTLMLAVSFHIEGSGSSPHNTVTADAVLSGKNDAAIALMGKGMVAREKAGYKPMIISVAWEANGNWFHHSAADPKKYIAAFQRIVRITRETGSKARFAWVLVKGYSHYPPSHNPLDAYPGDDYVDMIGVDIYDHYSVARTDAELQRELNQAGGGRWWANIAANRRKGFIIQEWGIKNAPQAGGDKGGGDSAFFVEGMWRFFKECHEREDLQFEGEIYFSEDNPSNVGSSLVSGRNPKATAKYAELWRR